MATTVVEEKASDLYDLTPGQDNTEMPEKTSQKQLYIRRAIEDRMEQKRLEEMSEDSYWDNL
ncbi:PA3496 family putative envelope integrity protein [Parendozoicomonas haliclonae]|uniref:Uncharacterized protein n=1 Tax=Parendozoicomonas haliclonae TaxID=1960125 RepID=A0A1X7AK15_9GAMM|nr:hypothetical protein [Parendozoicomonas haliclonae]SMA46703.1 hypothetical protein EHSB41UT_02242 [Parendozoicomonas haliclonae]